MNDRPLERTNPKKYDKDSRQKAAVSDFVDPVKLKEEMEGATQSVIGVSSERLEALSKMVVGIHYNDYFGDPIVDEDARDENSRKRKPHSLDRAGNILLGSEEEIQKYSLAFEQSAAIAECYNSKSKYILLTKKEKGSDQNQVQVQSLETRQPYGEDGDVGVPESETIPQYESMDMDNYSLFDDCLREAGNNWGEAIALFYDRKVIQKGYLTEEDILFIAEMMFKHDIDISTQEINNITGQESIVKNDIRLVDQEIQNFLSNIASAEYKNAFKAFYKDKKENWPAKEPNMEEEKFFSTYSAEIGSTIDQRLINYYRIYYKFLLEQLDKNPKAPKKELLQQKQLLDILFEDMHRRYINYKRKEVEKLHPLKRRIYRDRLKIKESGNNVSGDIKSLNPIDIVMGNESIRNYVFQDNPTFEGIDKKKPNRPTIESLKEGDGNKYRTLFQDVINNKDFKPYENFFDAETGDIKIICDDGKIIDERNIDGIIKDMESKKAEVYMMDKIQIKKEDLEEIKKIKEDIDATILNLAKKEQFREFMSERKDEIDGKINKNSVRMSAMICCIRAISSLFDTTNNNKENFASEFMIENINENVSFEPDSDGGGILSITGTINGKIVKLYYDVTKGVLLFNEFLYKDNSGNYHIGGKEGGVKQEIKEEGIKMPTIQEMEGAANEIDIVLPDKTRPLDRAKTTTSYMSDAIWSSVFLREGGLDLEANKLLVKNFNEKNLLKQEIVSCIYGSFYNEDSLDNLFNHEQPHLISNSDEQHDMIELIYNSINQYSHDTTELLKFRNCIIKLGNLLQNPENIDKLRNCVLLDYLFLDNPYDNDDAYSHTYEILGNTTKDGNQTNNMNRYLQAQPAIVSNQKEKKKEINFYTFLNLFAEENGKNSYINIEVFEKILELIEKNTGDGLDPLEIYYNDENNDNVFTDKYPVRKVENGIID